MRHSIRWWTAAAILFVGTGLTLRQAEAQSGETSRTAAESLFVEAKKLMEAGKYPEACAKFADSQRLDPGVGTLLNLARCYERQGKVASAWSTYREAAAAARSAGQNEREGVARQSAAALEPRLSRLTVTLPSALANAEAITVKLDGVALPSSLWGVAAPVDPGEHAIEVSAPGKKPWSTRVQVAPPSNPTVAVPELEAGPAETKSSANADVPPTSPGRGASQRTVALVLGGAGVVGLAAGTFFGLSARSTYHEGDDGCSAKNVCNTNGTNLRNDAYDKATIATIAFGVAGVGLASGAILWFTAPKGDPDAPRVGVAIAPRALNVQGAW